MPKLVRTKRMDPTAAALQTLIALGQSQNAGIVHLMELNRSDQADLDALPEALRELDRQLEAMARRRREMIASTKLLPGLIEQRADAIAQATRSPDLSQETMMGLMVWLPLHWRRMMSGVSRAWAPLNAMGHQQMLWEHTPSGLMPFGTAVSELVRQAINRRMISPLSRGRMTSTARDRQDRLHQRVHCTVVERLWFSRQTNQLPVELVAACAAAEEQASRNDRGGWNSNTHVCPTPEIHSSYRVSFNGVVVFPRVAIGRWREQLLSMIEKEVVVIVRS
jgi:hypothetical protein